MNWKKAFVYFFILLTGLPLVLILTKNLGILSIPLWGIIAFMGILENPLRLASLLLKQRYLHTLLGIILVPIIYFIFGYHLILLILITAFLMGILSSFYKYPANWKIAPITFFILYYLTGLLDPPSNTLVLNYSFSRISEVFIGTSIAFIEIKIIKYIFKNM